ncbi:transposase [Paenibacillus sp. GSMTC-2017]|nr:transposase [Paenibacillus sp. GSMTC-2017]
MHSDAYSGYVKLAVTTSCLCWAHLRRKFVEALLPEAKQLEGTLVSEGVAYCDKLFELESERNNVWCRKNLYSMFFGHR